LWRLRFETGHHVALLVHGAQGTTHCAVFRFPVGFFGCSARRPAIEGDLGVSREHDGDLGGLTPRSALPGGRSLPQEQSEQASATAPAARRAQAFTLVGSLFLVGVSWRRHGLSGMGTATPGNRRGIMQKLGL
jgi:hypothetical protein